MEAEDIKTTIISEITIDNIADYIRLTDPTNEDKRFLNSALEASKAYILSHTGIPKEEELDKYKDLVIVVYVLCQDMYDNRSLYVDKNNVNKVVETILGFHDFNLL